MAQINLMNIDFCKLKLFFILWISYFLLHSTLPEQKIIQALDIKIFFFICMIPAKHEQKAFTQHITNRKEKNSQKIYIHIKPYNSIYRSIPTTPCCSWRYVTICYGNSNPHFTTRIVSKYLVCRKQVIGIFGYGVWVLWFLSIVLWEKV